MITITVTQDNKTLTISQPSDIPLTETDDSYYSWKHVFANILFWLTFPPDTINSVMPDCEECDVVEELNREHNAELSAQCERCEYKTDGVSDEDETDSRCCKTCRHLGVLPSEPPCEGCVVENNRKHYYNHWEEKDNVQEEVNMEVTMDDNMEVNEERSCDNCNATSLNECYGCNPDKHEGETYIKWQPKKEPPIITEEKETVKDCETCEYFDNKDFEHPCDVCVCFDGEGKAIVPTHWQPISVKTSNDETTGKSEIKGWINRDIEL